jgi:hypothetical protein
MRGVETTNRMVLGETGRSDEKKGRAKEWETRLESTELFIRHTLIADTFHFR